MEKRSWDHIWPIQDYYASGASYIHYENLSQREKKLISYTANSRCATAEYEVLYGVGTDNVPSNIISSLHYTEKSSKMVKTSIKMQLTPNNHGPDN